MKIDLFSLKKGRSSMIRILISILANAGGLSLKSNGNQLLNS